MLKGTVKHFSVEKQFGFLTYEGQEVFFHKAFGGMMAVLDDGVPTFLKCEQERAPKAGDTLLFKYDEGPRGLRATQWAFPESLQTALKQLASLKQYRLVERKGRIMKTRLYNEMKAKYNVLYEGTNLEKLRTEYPKEKYPLHDNEYSALYFKIKMDDDWTDYQGDPR